MTIIGCPLCCRQTFNSVLALREHLLYFTYRPLLCMLCGLSTSGIYELTRHLESHLPALKSDSVNEALHNHEGKQTYPILKPKPLYLNKNVDESNECPSVVQSNLATYGGTLPSEVYRQYSQSRVFVDAEARTILQSTKSYEPMQNAFVHPSRSIHSESSFTDDEDTNNPDWSPQDNHENNDESQTMKIQNPLKSCDNLNSDIFSCQFCGFKGFGKESYINHLHMCKFTSSQKVFTSEKETLNTIQSIDFKASNIDDNKIKSVPTQRSNFDSRYVKPPLNAHTTMKTVGLSDNAQSITKNLPQQQTSTEHFSTEILKIHTGPNVQASSQSNMPSDSQTLDLSCNKTQEKEETNLSCTKTQEKKETNVPVPPKPKVKRNTQDPLSKKLAFVRRQKLSLASKRNFKRFARSKQGSAPYMHKKFDRDQGRKAVLVTPKPNVQCFINNFQSLLVNKLNRASEVNVSDFKYPDTLKLNPKTPPSPTPLPGSSKTKMPTRNTKSRKIAVDLVHKNSSDVQIKKETLPKTSRAIKQDLKCKYCSKTFPSQTTLDVHVKQKICLPFKCKFCKKSFSKPFILRRHEKEVHSNMTYYCNLCGKHFKTKLSLTNHKGTHESKKFACSKCEYLCHTSAGLRVHVYENHSNSKKSDFTCELCGEKFKRNYGLKRHKERKHTDSSLLCRYCDKAFTCREDLSNHLNTHLDTKSFTCPICNSIFSTLGALKRHKNRHTDRDKGVKSFQCTSCPAVFTRQDSLSFHIKSMHKIDRPFVCHCGKKFAKKCLLKYHSNVHLKQVKYRCRNRPKALKSTHNAS